MAIGKEIKVVLTLDDSGFTAKTKGASEVVKALETNLTNFGQSSKNLDASINVLSSGISSFAKSFKSVESSLKLISTQFKETVDRLSSLRASAETTAGSVNALGAATKKMSSVSASQWVTRFERDLKALPPALRQAVQGILSLNTANKESAASAKAMADGTVAAKLKTLAAEREANAKIIAERIKLAEELLILQRSMDARSSVNAAVGKRFFGKNAPKAEPYNNDAAAFNSAAQAAKNEALAVQALVKELQHKNAVIDALIREIKAEAAALVELEAVAARVGATQARLAVEAKEALARQVAAVHGVAAAVALADKESESSARQAANARVRFARETAAEEKIQAASVGAIWKGMAQLYAGAKIEKGLATSLKSADDYARVIERINAAGIDGAAGKKRVLSVARTVEDSNPNLNKTQALQLTMSAVAGTVSTDQKMLTAVVPEISKVLTVMTRQFPEQAHNLENFGRNVMGVMEARGITNDPKKMLETLDNLARALILTQGKMSVQDYETISRRGGAGNAQLKDNDSILFDIAAASQMKVMGGSGGGAGGVSTFATMQRGAAKRADGGVRETREATENLVEMGVIDRQKLLDANGGKALGRNYKTVKYEGADKAADNMTLFAMELVEKVKAKLAALPENDLRFFAKGADRTDDKVQAKAFGQFADKSFGNTQTAEFYKMFASKGSNERINSEVQASKDSPDYSQAHSEAMKSWGVAVEITKASLEKLGVVVGNILIPVLQPLLGMFTSLVDAAKNFGENNPIAAKFLTIGAAALSVNLLVRGMVNSFGLVSNVSTLLGSLARSAKGAEDAHVGLSGSTTAYSSAARSSAVAAEQSAAAHVKVALANLQSARAVVANSSATDKAAAIAGALIPAQQAASAAVMNHASAQAAMGVATKAASVGTRLATGALGLVGGPLGLISIALTIGITAWEMFGSAADSASKKARDSSIESANAVQAAVIRMRNDVQNLQKGANGALIFTENVKIGELGERLKAAQKDKKKADAQLQSELSSGFGEGISNSASDSRSAQKQIQSISKEILDRTAGLNQVKMAEAQYNAALKEKNKTDKEEAKKETAAEVAQAQKDNPAPAATAGGGSGLFKEPKEPKAKIVSTDPLTAAIAVAGGKIESQQKQLEAMVTGASRIEALKEQVAAEIEGKRTAGEYDPNRDESKRPAADSKQIKELNEVMVLKAERAEQLKAVEFAQERVAASSIEAQDAFERLANDGAPKQTDAFRALERELARLEIRMGVGTENFKAYAKVKADAFAARTMADAANYTVDDSKDNKSMIAGLKNTDFERRQAEIDNVRDTEEKKYNLIMETAEKAHKAALAATERTIANEETRNSTLLAMQEKYDGELESLRAARQVTQDLRDKVDARKLESSVEAMSRTWKDTGKAIDDIQTRTAENFVSMLTANLGKGRMDIKGFLTGVLTDIANAKLKETLADPLKDLIGKGGDLLKKKLFNLIPDDSAGAFSKADDGSSNAAEMAKLARQAAGASSALGSMASDGVGKAAAALAEQALSATTDITATMAFTTAITVATESLTMFVASMGASGASSGGGGIVSAGVDIVSNLFADGGIMTNSGPVQLRKYANGGIANSPQLALYGEAGPEAYVPLPDGRTIPVTMKGGGQQAMGAPPAVTVNVINQTSQQTNAEQGQMRFDGKQYVLDVVLTAMNQPGPFRNGMKTAQKA